MMCDREVRASLGVSRQSRAGSYLTGLREPRAGPSRVWVNMIVKREPNGPECDARADTVHSSPPRSGLCEAVHGHAIRRI